jgi:hypothetical protein
VSMLVIALHLSCARRKWHAVSTKRKEDRGRPGGKQGRTLLSMAEAGEKSSEQAGAVVRASSCVRKAGLGSGSARKAHVVKSVGWWLLTDC